MYVFIHQKILIQHLLWLDKVLGDEDTAANKTKIPDLMDHTWLVEEVNEKNLKYKVQQTVLSAKEKNQARKRNRKCQHGEGVQLLEE